MKKVIRSIKPTKRRGTTKVVCIFTHEKTLRYPSKKGERRKNRQKARLSFCTQDTNFSFDFS